MDRTFEVEPHLAPYVKEVALIEGGGRDEETRLPFYADGYPGIMYGETAHPIILQPQGKELSTYFLYGQTIAPIELRIIGPYRLIVHQLYPFATRLILGVDPHALNDACFDLTSLYTEHTGAPPAALRSLPTTSQLEHLSGFLLHLVDRAAVHPDNAVKMAVTTIIDRKGSISITALRDQLHLTERTFERRFLREIGVTPKQFARIVQFGFSLDQLKASDYTSLTNVAYDNGFADQSHFIRTFKQYTGRTPKELLAQLD